MSNPVEDLLIAHVRDARAKIAAASATVDALEAQIAKLKERLDNGESPLPQPTTRSGPNGWSKEEDDLLREKYPLLGAKGCKKFLPHRSSMAIRVRASRNLGLLYTPTAQRIWCDQCQARVTSEQVASCQSKFCQPKALVA